jgi:hypothetical protein
MAGPLALLGGLCLLYSHALAQPSVVGSWSPVYTWPDVAIHLHLLPDGRILAYADDDNPDYNVNGTRLGGFTRAFLIDLPIGGVPGAVVEVDNDRSNMFCSGHNFTADGRLFVVGGHMGQDGWGEPRTQFFDYRDPTRWGPGPDMYQGRWYPSACMLANGDVLAISGTREPAALPSDIPEVWSSDPGGNSWRQLTNAVRTLPYYPFTFLAPDGRVFVAGPQRDTRYLDCSGLGAWTFVSNHILNATRSYGSAVQYADGKFVVVGGADPPTSTCEIIDLNVGTPAWQSTGSMMFARRQMNATILPDGTVLATGGTSSAGFNDNVGAVLAAELWTPPPAGTWAQMASAARTRLYHSTTLLLPDGRVLSAGSGRPKASNGGVDQLNAEIYSPPYLFKGARPSIASVPSVINNGVPFTIVTPDAPIVAQVTLIRLGTTTHAFNQGQRFNRLTFSAGPGTLQTSAPSSSTLCPPGFYMLFILNATGVPSVAKMVQVVPPGPVGITDPPGDQLLDFIRLTSANPSRGQARIALTLSRSEAGRVEILDVTGRRVKVLMEGLFVAGQEMVVTWDGTNERGERVKGGVYWYRLQTPSVTRTGRIAFLSHS